MAQFTRHVITYPCKQEAPGGGRQTVGGGKTRPLQQWSFWYGDENMKINKKKHIKKNDKSQQTINHHDGVIKWKHFLRYWPFVQGIHWSLVNSPHKGRWCGALMFPFICTWTNSWANNADVCDLRRHRTHYDVIVMIVVQIALLLNMFTENWCHLTNWPLVML